MIYLIFQSNAWLHDFQFYQSKHHSPSTNQRVVRWKSPSRGWLKIIWMGLFSSSESWGGIGIIIRDDAGKCVGGTCACVHNVNSPEQVEALAGLMAVRLAQDGGLSPVVFETDSLILTNTVRHQTSPNSLLGLIYEDIVEGLGSIPGSSFHHVFRQANAVAHFLARRALCHDFSSSWGTLPPDFLLDVLEKDLHPLS